MKIEKLVIGALLSLTMHGIYSAMRERSILYFSMVYIFFCLKGFHASFKNTQGAGGLSLNIDVTDTLTVTPGPVLDFLVANQGRDGISIDWKKAKSTLRNLRINIITSNREYKIAGLSGLCCKDQTSAQSIYVVFYV
ncbi:unnamed protein product [Microthlaspi erraticum]|uniref:Argonaute linker 1 domain-containing protein n=1 Tax=Microthlaspi erraticum TaxID=1685480 RepID=A0A6D2L3J0_9BRAS|nr:unnamed protein product [Microthlaspi erraticum]